MYDKPTYAAGSYPEIMSLSSDGTRVLLSERELRIEPTPS